MSGRPLDIDYSGQSAAAEAEKSAVCGVVPSEEIKEGLSDSSGMCISSCLRLLKRRVSNHRYASRRAASMSQFTSVGKCHRDLTDEEVSPRDQVKSNGRSPPATTQSEANGGDEAESPVLWGDDARHPLESDPVLEEVNSESPVNSLEVLRSRRPSSDASRSLPARAERHDSAGKFSSSSSSCSEFSGIMTETTPRRVCTTSGLARKAQEAVQSAQNPEPDEGLCGRRISAPHSSQSPTRRPRGAVELSAKPPEDTPAETLGPCADPEKSLARALLGMKSADWSTILQSVNSVRRISVHHPRIIVPNLHPVVLELAAQADNLRSSVSKGAVMCFTEILRALGKSMDAEADFVAESLLKKTGESNKFIADEAQLSLEALITGVSAQRALAALLKNAAHKNSVVRLQVSKFLKLLLSRMSAAAVLNSGSASGLFTVVAQFLEEGSWETRLEAKNIVVLLQKTLGETEFEKCCGRHLTERKRAKFLEIIARHGSGTSGTLKRRTEDASAYP